MDFVLKFSNFFKHHGYWIFFLVVIFLNIFSCTSEYIYGKQSSSIEDFYVNSNALSITSLQFNPTRKTSDWLQHIFGSLSVNFDTSSERPASSLQVNNVELAKSQERFYNNLAIPSEAAWPMCSIEILGYGRIGLQSPFLSTFRSKKPSGGFATLDILFKKGNSFEPLMFDCYYRAVYENWRIETSYTEPNFWPVLIYCPVKLLTNCERMKKHVQNNPTSPVVMRLTLNLKEKKLAC